MSFLATFFAVSATMVAAVMPAFELTGSSFEHRPYPAAPGYLLPWAGGEIHEVTQGEETAFTHNGHAAYAFDFNLHYDTVVAARSGRVAMVRQDSNSGGCNASYSAAANYVVIDHGDGTSALYLHLANQSVTVRPGDLVDQGAPIAISGETGLTCSDAMDAPAPHLHFQVEKTEASHYFTQSLPVAFDDLSKEGVPVQGKSYVSGNFGRGKPQKIGLTPHRVPREFHPVATPADPALREGDPNAIVTPVPGSPDAPLLWTLPDTPTPHRPRPTRTPTVTPTPTPIATATLLPPETPTVTPVPPTETPTPANTPLPSDTPLPPATSTPTPAETPTDTPTPPI